MSSCICLTCRQSPRLHIGSRVTVSDLEKSSLGKDLRGEVVAIGHPETRRRGTVKVKWNDAHKDQWWPKNALFLEEEGHAAAAHEKKA